MSVVLLVLTCIATALTIRLLQRFPRLVFVATLLGSIVLLALLLNASDEPLSLFGRTLTIAFAGRVFLWPAVGIAAALACFGPLAYEAPNDSPTSVIANAQGSFFFLSLALLIVAMALDSFPLAAFLWAVGVMVLILLARPQREGRAGGAAQFVLLAVIATASLLLSSRFLELYPLSPDNLDLARSAFLFLAWGLGLLLAIVPLHIWLGPLADEMPVLGIAFLVGVAQPVGLWLLFQLMTQVLWLTDKVPLLDTLLLAGIVMGPAGALLTLAERRHGRFVAYLSLVSLGHALVGFGLGTRLALAGAMLALLNRAIGIALLAGGLTLARYHIEKKWQYIGAFSTLVGGLALTGLPPLLGAAARWSIYRTLAEPYPLVVGLLLASDAAALMALTRVASPLFRDAFGAVESTGEIKIVPYLCTAVIAVLVAVIVIVGLFPQLVANPLIATLANADYLK